MFKKIYEKFVGVSEKDSSANSTADKNTGMSLSGNPYLVGTIPTRDHDPAPPGSSLPSGCGLYEGEDTGVGELVPPSEADLSGCLVQPSDGKPALTTTTTTEPKPYQSKRGSALQNRHAAHVDQEEDHCFTSNFDPYTTGISDLNQNVNNPFSGNMHRASGSMPGASGSEPEACQNAAQFSADSPNSGQLLNPFGGYSATESVDPFASDWVFDRVRNEQQQLRANAKQHASDLAQALQIDMGSDKNEASGLEMTVKLGSCVRLDAPLAWKLHFPDLIVDRFLNVSRSKLGRTATTEVLVRKLVNCISVLFKYAQNLTSHADSNRPDNWMSIRLNNAVYADRVAPIPGAHAILAKLGYTNFTDDALLWKCDANTIPESSMIQLLADLKLTRRELEQFAKGRHPCPRHIEDVVGPLAVPHHNEVETVSVCCCCSTRVATLRCGECGSPNEFCRECHTGFHRGMKEGHKMLTWIGSDTLDQERNEQESVLLHQPQDSNLTHRSNGAARSVGRTTASPQVAGHARSNYSVPGVSNNSSNPGQPRAQPISERIVGARGHATTADSARSRQAYVPHQPPALHQPAVGSRPLHTSAFSTDPSTFHSDVNSLSTAPSKPFTLDSVTTSWGGVSLQHGGDDLSIPALERLVENLECTMDCLKALVLKDNSEVNRLAILSCTKKLTAARSQLNDKRSTLTVGSSPFVMKDNASVAPPVEVSMPSGSSTASNVSFLSSQLPSKTAQLGSLGFDQMGNDVPLDEMATNVLWKTPAKGSRDSVSENCIMKEKNQGVVIQQKMSADDSEWRVTPDIHKQEGTVLLSVWRIADLADLPDEIVSLALQRDETDTGYIVGDPCDWLESTVLPATQTVIRKAAEHGHAGITPREACRAFLLSDQCLDMAKAIDTACQLRLQLREECQHLGHRSDELGGHLSGPMYETQACVDETLDDAAGDVMADVCSRLWMSDVDLIGDGCLGDGTMSVDDTSRSGSSGARAVRELGGSGPVLSLQEQHVSDTIRQSLQLTADPGVRERLSRMAMIEFNLDGLGKTETFLKVLENDEVTACVGEILEAVKACRGLERTLDYLHKECEVCFEAVSRSALVSLMCEKGCRICHDCFVGHFTVQIKENQVRSFVCPVCPGHEVEDVEYMTILDGLLQNCLLPDVYDMFQKKVRDWTLQKDANFRWCVHCVSGFVFEQGANNLNARVTCNHCQKRMCAKCDKPWEDQHEQLSCDKFRQWKIDNDPELQAKGLGNYIEQNGIRCPGCKLRFELSKGGCIHFTCSQCKFEFCAGCNQEFTHVCRLFDDCQRGLHCHHPRNCFYYLRDMDLERLQQLLDQSDVGYRELLRRHHGGGETMDVGDEGSDSAGEAAGGATAAPASRCCTVMEQKEKEGDILADEQCGKPCLGAEEGEEDGGGLCQAHYKEFLVMLINHRGIDPARVMDTEELLVVVGRERLSGKVRKQEAGESEEDFAEYLQGKLVEHAKVAAVDGGFGGGIGEPGGGVAVDDPLTFVPPHHFRADVDDGELLYEFGPGSIEVQDDYDSFGEDEAPVLHIPVRADAIEIDSD